MVNSVNTNEQCLFTVSDPTSKADVGKPVYMYRDLTTLFGNDIITLNTVGVERDITGEARCSGVSFKQINNRENATSYTYPLQIRPKNLATGELAGGPRIPIDLLMQCSDDGAFECEDQSTCMHMVTFKSAGDADEELAKRGFVCKSTKDDRSNPGERAIRAKMECELQDGRKFQIALSQQETWTGNDEDGRVGVVITELDNSSGN
jgi:hypothetical protein